MNREDLIYTQIIEFKLLTAEKKLSGWYQPLFVPNMGFVCKLTNGIKKIIDNLLVNKKINNCWSWSNYHAL